MKKVIKKTNRTKKQTNKHRIVFVLVFIIYLASSLLLKNVNVGLNHTLQDLINENKQLVNNNQTLKIKVDDLSSFERMNSIAKKNGLENREGSIKNVK